MALESLGHRAIHTSRVKETRRLHVEAPALEVGPEARVDNLQLDRAAASRAGVPMEALRHAGLIERPPLMVVDAESSQPERSGVSTS